MYFKSFLNKVVPYGGLLLASVLLISLFGGLLSGYVDSGDALIGAIGICAAIGFALTLRSMLPGVATGLYFFVVATCVVFLGVRIYSDFSYVRGLIQQTDVAMDQLLAEAAGKPNDGQISEADFAQVLPELNQLRDLP
ncbi:MAG: hypothetical protein AAGF22_10300, partial [Pseudomonadota bacterium]